MNATPMFEALAVFAAGDCGYFCFRIPAVVVTTGGTVLAFCEARRENCADWAVTDLVVKRSFDHGCTWEPLRVIAGDGVHTTNQPCAVVDGTTGIVWLLFCHDNQRVFVTRSVDDGATWSEPVEITQQVKDPGWHYLGTGPGHGIQLMSGRLLMPGWGDISPGPVTWRPSPNWGKCEFSCTFYSDDHGLTWKRGQPLTEDLSDECEIVETTSGKLYMTMRSRRRQYARAYAWSDDGGVTWTEVQFDKNLPEPSCQGGIVRLSGQGRDGWVLLCHPAAIAERARLTVRGSRDECRTWSVSRIVEHGSCGYSDLAMASDGTILCLYEAEHRYEGMNPFEGGWGVWKPEDIHRLEADPDCYSNLSRESKIVLARFNLEWLTASP